MGQARSDGEVRVGTGRRALLSLAVETYHGETLKRTVIHSVAEGSER